MRAGERAALQPPAERLALQELEDDVRDAAFAAHVEDGEDVRMVQGGDGPGFLLKAAQPLRVGGVVRRQDLEGDLSAEAGVAGPVDLTHPPGADGGETLVRAETAARHERHDSWDLRRFCARVIPGV